MKVLNLQCTHLHSFEGWFASEDDFQAQLTRGQVECPMCADKSVQKMPSAPRLNLGALAPTPGSPSMSSPENGEPAGTVPATRLPAAPSEAQQAAFLNALRHVMSHTEDVGKRFADEARRIHHGDAEARNIRGQTSMHEALALLEEGIEVLPLPLPAALKETLQ